MAWTLTQAQDVKLMAKVETTPGTDAIPIGGTDDVLLFNSTTPVRIDPIPFNLTPHNTDLYPQVSNFGNIFVDVSFSFFMQGSDSVGDEDVNGYKGISALLQCCGLDETVDAGVSITYTPVTTAADAKTTTLYIAIDGRVHKITNVRGNIQFAGNPENGLQCDFTGRGAYTDPVAISTLFDNWTGGTNRAEAFLDVSGSVNDGTNTYSTDFVFDTFVFNTGNNITDVRDANQASGIKQFAVTAIAPTMEITLAMDADGSALIGYEDFLAHLQAKTLHKIAWSYGSGAGRHIAFTTNDTTNNCQIMNVTSSDRNDYKLNTITYALRKQAGDIYTLTIT